MSWTDQTSYVFSWARKQSHLEPRTRRTLVETCLIHVWGQLNIHYLILFVDNWSYNVTIFSSKMLFIILNFGGKITKRNIEFVGRAHFPGPKPAYVWICLAGIAKSRIVKIELNLKVRLHTAINRV